MRRSHYFTRRQAALRLFALIAMQVEVTQSWAVITASGNFSPALPAAGGTIAGEVIVGVGNASEDVLFGTMTVDGGTVLADSDGTIGDLSGAFGQVLITGRGSAWNHGDDLTVGDEGWGDLSVESAGRARVTDDMFIGGLETGHGEVFLDGVPSLLEVEDDLEIGSEGVAYLQASSGGQIQSGDAVIGRASGSDGHVLLQGSPTQWTNLRDIVIGSAGTGRLDIASAARVNQRAGIVGEAAGSFGTVTVTGSQSYWSMTTDLTIGASGTGDLFVSGGGQVVNRVGTIGSAALGRGTATVSGDGSIWRLSSQFSIGVTGTGFLNIDSGGLVNAAAAATVGPRGLVTFNGGRLVAPSLVNNGIIGGTGEITSSLGNGATGEVRVAVDEHLRVTGTVTNSGRLEAFGGEIEFLSVVTNGSPSAQIAVQDGSLRFHGGLTNQGGVVAVSGTNDVFGPVTNEATGSIVAGGDSVLVFYDDVSNTGLIEALPGSTIVFARDLGLGSASSLALVLAGLDVGEDLAQFEIAGDAALAGDLDVALAPTFLPAVGDSFTLLAAAGGVSGTFANTALPSLPTGLSWLLAYSDSDVVLRVAAAAALAGDYNGNGAVEQADLDLVLLNWGGAGSPPPAGWIKDLPEGQIDQGELDGILLNWGNAAPSVLGGSSVPEPSCIVLAVALAALVWSMTSRIGDTGTTPVSR